MRQKSIPPFSRQAGASMTAVLVGAAIAALLLAISVIILQNLRENSRVERTLSAIYLLKEEVKRASHTQGSYMQGRMMPVLFASKSFPAGLDVDYERRTVTTPLKTTLDVTGRGGYFSIDLYGLTPNDCYDMGTQIMQGHYFALGNGADDLHMVQIGDAAFDDKAPIAPETLQHACTARSSIDVIMAFR